MTSATQIAYLHLCHRKLWLTGKGIRLENASSNQYVEEGKQISESTYTRRPSKWRELALQGIKIDHFDPQTATVKEVKKSPKLAHAHVAQVQYYLYRLEKAGIQQPKGVIEYPKQRKTQKVSLDKATRETVEHWLQEVDRLINLTNCPEVINKPYCKTCAFRDFCYV